MDKNIQKPLINYRSKYPEGNNELWIKISGRQ